MAAGLAMLGGGALSGQDLPQWVLQLSRVKRQAKSEQSRLPNFACIETFNRSHSQPNSREFKPIDTIRMDVAFVDGRELVAPVGSSGGFQEMDLQKWSTGGIMGTGAFSAVARNLFIHDNGRVTGWAEERIFDRPALRYDFVVPEMLAGYSITSNGRVGSVGLAGSFWADAETLELLRIDEHAVDIPPTLDVESTSTSVTYAKVRIGSSDVRLARTAETEIVNKSGWRGRNVIEFSGCREYVANSVIHFDSVEPEPPPKKK